jgi:serine/threonine protein kinase
MPAYELREKIGEGAMGTVYRAESSSSRGSVAVKLLKPSLLGDKAALLRFEKEAHAISQMTHPNIVQIYGVSAQDDDPYIVMEYVEGESLADILKPGRTVSPERVIDWTMQICSAMKHAHDKGIVHRDLKPSNILLAETPRGEEIKLVDFGIAKLASGNGKLTELTQKGEVLGSPNYMSPEQCQGKPVDARSDIYALGCIIYEALSGKTLFVADNSIQILVQHISSPVGKQLQDLQRSGISASLVSVLSKMLEKDPEKRYQNAELVLNEFERLKAGRRSDASQLRLKKKAMVAVVVAAIVGFAAFAVSNHPAGNLAPDVGLYGASEVPGASPLDLFGNSAQSKLDRYIKASKENTAWLTIPGPKDNNERMQRSKALNELREQTRVDVTSMGATAVPALLANLKIAEVAAICDSALTDIGAEAVDPLIDWLRHHPKNDQTVTDILLRIGRPAGDKLALLTKGTESDKRMAAYVLANQFILPRLIRGQRMRIPFRVNMFMSSSSQNYLVEALSDTKDTEVRRHLVEALLNIYDPSPQTLDAIEDVLAEDHDEETRMAAAQTLSLWLDDVSAGPSQPILKALTHSLTKDQSSDVRRTAALALGNYKKPSPALIQEVRKAEQDTANSVRQAAFVTLSKYAVHDQEAMPDLIGALKEQDRDTVQNALQAVEKAGPRAVSAVPALIAIDTNAMPGLQTLNAIKATDSDSPAVVKIMLDRLEANPAIQTTFDKRTAIQYFEHKGPRTAAIAVPALKKLAQGNGPEGNMAKQALTQLGVTEQ